MSSDLIDVIVANIKRLKPIVLANLVADPKIPWFTEIPGDDVPVSALTALITSYIGEGQIKSIAKSRGLTKDGRFLSTAERMVFLYAEDGEVGGLSYWKRDEAAGYMYTAFVRFGNSGTLMHEKNMFHQSFHKLTDKIGPNPNLDAAYLFSHVLDVTLTSSYSPDGSGDSISGIERNRVDGIDVHVMRPLDIDDLRQGEKIHLSPRLVPAAMRSYMKEVTYVDPSEVLPQQRMTRLFSSDLTRKLSLTDQMWWVSHDMSALAWDTVLSGTLPDDIDDEPLPAPSGIMWLDGGVGPALMTKKPLGREYFETGIVRSDPLTINAIAWFVPSRELAAAIGWEYGETYFVQLSGSPDLVEDTNHWTGGYLSYIDLGSVALLDHRLAMHSPLEVRPLSSKLVRAAMRLSRESLVGERQIERVITGGKKRKPIQIDDVVIAVLRRRKYASEEEREKEYREYSHRFIVRGHMRNQAVGSRTAEGGQRHERIWIAPYIKGPEDKPLIVKDRVQVWRR